MPDSRPLSIVEPLPLPDGGRGLVVQAQAPGERLVIWPGEAPPLPPAHPALATRAGLGEGLWVEHLPPDGALLSWLRPPLRALEAAEVLARIADALAALHDSGMWHGELGASRVVLDADGLPQLIGTARSREGSPRADLSALGALWAAWCPDGPLLDLSSAAATAEGLRIWLSVSGEPATPALPVLVREAQRAPLPDADPVTLGWSDTFLEGPIDEVGVDLGPDAGGGGLLDPLSWSSLTGDPTSERTGAVETTSSADSGDTRVEAPHAALLARIHQIIHQPLDPGRFAPQEGSRPDALMRLLRTEPLDVLPTPDGGAPRPEITGTAGWEEHTATQIQLVELNLPPAPPPAPAPSPTPAPPPAAPARALEISPVVMGAAVVAALLAGAAGIWLLLSSLSGP